jgi:hypothetical protein
MERIKPIEPLLCGKIIAAMEEVHDGYALKLVIRCTDGTVITVFGGTVGYDTAEPHYEIAWNTVVK